jgi:hypothetical protein
MRPLSRRVLATTIVALMASHLLLWIASARSSRRWANYRNSGRMLVLDSDKSSILLRLIRRSPGAPSQATDDAVPIMATSGDPYAKPQTTAVRLLGGAFIRSEYVCGPVGASGQRIAGEVGASVLQPVAPAATTPGIAVTSLGIALPHWFLALALSLLPLRALFLRSRSKRRKRLGWCPCCGYDLRSSTRRCPECGEPAAAAASPAAAPLVPPPTGLH